MTLRPTHSGGLPMAILATLILWALIGSVVL